MPAAVLEGGMGQCDRDGRLGRGPPEYSRGRRGRDRRGGAAARRARPAFERPCARRVCGSRSAMGARALGGSATASESTLRSCGRARRLGSRAARRSGASARDGRLSPAVAGLYALPGEVAKLAPELAPGGRAATARAKTLVQHAHAHSAGRPLRLGDERSTPTPASAATPASSPASPKTTSLVGPDQIRMGRDMHWLRIDVYDHRRRQNPRPVFQPVPCMQCETAPCEPVCPVEASVHDHEGLNVQVYNRCVGTRFCESNCPYKVRRFNFFGYADGQEYGDLGEPLVKAANNPNVSVRARGVMEKCTYCVQRISGARRLAERETRLIEDGEIVTACQAACPTQAIRFGNLADPKSAVSRLRRDPRHYTLLEELHTRPRTTYLARVVSNPTRRRRRDRRLCIRPRARARERTCSSPLDRRRRDHPPRLRPAHAFGGRIWWIAFLICSAGALATLSASTRSSPRRWHLGHQHQRGLGLRDRELCVVDRDRQRRHTDLLAAPAHAAVLARLDQPLRRSDDAIRCRDRGLFPIFISGGRFISTGSRPIPPRCRSGRNGAARSSGISGRSPAISSFRSSSGMSASCPISRRCGTAHAADGKRSTAPSRSAGAARHGIGAIITSFRSRLPLWRLRWSARCIRLSGSTSQPA